MVDVAGRKRSNRDRRLLSLTGINLGMPRLAFGNTGALAAPRPALTRDVYSLNDGVRTSRP